MFPPPDPRILLDELLDKGYTSAVAPVTNAILGDLNSNGLIGKRIRELEAEAERLALKGERLSPDNPVLRALRADLDTALSDYSQQMNNTADGVAGVGVNAGTEFVRQTTLPGISDAQMAVLGIEWRKPNADAVNALVNYTALPAWDAELGRYGDDIGDVVNNIAIRGFIDGWGASRIAREIVSTVETFPMAQANNLMRTLMLQSFRQSTALSQLENADILEPMAIWIAALDMRTCLYCLGQHGTRVPLGTVIVSHHQCRCTTIAVVIGRPISIQTGEDWYNSLSDADQRELAGGANYNALKAGAVSLSDFKHPYTDPVFGQMMNAGSLVDILGSQAQDYYMRNQ